MNEVSIIINGTNYQLMPDNEPNDIDIHITRSHDIIVWYDVLVGRKRFKFKEQQLKRYEQANSI